MVKPYSEDLRVRVVGRVEAGHPVRAVAETFGVRLRRAMRSPGARAVDGFGGAMLSVAAALGIVWIAAAVAVHLLTGRTVDQQSRELLALDTALRPPLARGRTLAPSSSTID